MPFVEQGDEFSEDDLEQLRVFFVELFWLNPASVVRTVGEAIGSLYFSVWKNDVIFAMLDNDMDVVFGCFLPVAATCAKSFDDGIEGL